VGGDSESERFFRALYSLYKFTGRFTVDGEYISEPVDISDALEVYDEVETHADGHSRGTHTAAKFNHQKLQAALNKAIGAAEDVFFNDLDDVEMELKPETPTETAAPGSGGGPAGSGHQPGGTPARPTGPDDPFTPQQPRPGRVPAPPARPPVKPRDVANEAPRKIKLKFRYTWPKKARPAPRPGGSR
jgi:hypothetical protein